MTRFILFLFFAVAAAGWTHASPPPIGTSGVEQPTSSVQPPFKTPEQLMDAVQVTLTAQDQNAFWSLFEWTNVPPRDAKIFKTSYVGCFMEPGPGNTIRFYDFKIETDNLPGPQDRYNLPITGQIFFGEQSKIPAEYGDELLTGHRRLAFGRDAAGNYRLGVSTLKKSSTKP